MALKLLRGSLINKEKPEELEVESPSIQPVNEEVIPEQEEVIDSGQQIQETPEEIPTGMTRAEADKLMEEKPEGQNVSNIFSRLGISLLEGLEAPAKLLDKASEALGIGQLTARGDYTSEQLRKGLGYSKEEIQPKTFVESFAQKVLKQTPTAALFGPQAAARTALSAIPASVTGAFGAPEWLQDLVQLGADIGIGVKGIGKLGIKPSVTTKPLRDAQKKAYDTAKHLAVNRKDASADTIINSLTGVAKKLTRETDGNIVKRVNHVMDTVQNNIKLLADKSGQNIQEIANPEAIMDIRRNLNKMYDKNKDLIEYTQPIIDSFNTYFGEYSVKNPKFFEALKKGDQLTSAVNIKSNIIDKITDFIPSMGGIGNTIKKILTPTLGSTEKVLRQITSSPEARKAYLDMGKSIVEGNPTVLMNNVKNLEEAINVKEEPYFRPRKAKAKKKYKIISGSKIK